MADYLPWQHGRVFNWLARTLGKLMWVLKGRPRWKRIKRKRCPICGRRLRPQVMKESFSMVFGCCDRCHHEYQRRITQLRLQSRRE